MNRANQDFERLYRQYFARVYRFLRAMRFDDDQARDLTQDTFKRLYEHMSVRAEITWPYLETIVRNVAFNAIRHANAQKRAVVSESLETLAEPPDVSTNPFTGEEPETQEHVLIRQEETRRLTDAIHSLPPGARHCMLLWIQGFTYDEIARALRLSTVAVKSRLRDAKRELRLHLDGSA